MKKLTNFYIDEELINNVDDIISKSNNKYKDRTQFIVLAIQEKINNENI